MTKKHISTFLRVFAILFTVVFFYQLSVKAYSSSREQQADISYLPLVDNNYAGSGGPTPSPGNSFVEGYVTDARTSDPIADATVCLEDTSICDSTGPDGFYRLENVPAGGYTFEANSASQDYNSVAKDAVIQTNSTVTLNFALLHILYEGEIRIVLTWDSTPTWPPEDLPNDLNLHMWTELEPPDHHIFIGNIGNCENLEVSPYACYESDEQKGSGPDAIVLREDDTSVFSFAVLNYYADRTGVPPITSLNARVRVYNADTLLREFVVPPTGDGDLWYVFDLEYGDIIPQNCLTQYNEPGDVPPICP
jgi:hypothetical protein